MRYMLLINATETEENKFTEAQMGQMMAGYQKFTEDLQAAGAFLDAARLQPVSSATTVRVRNGQRLLSDGPFAETKEQMGGYYLINVPNLDEALAWAAKIPSAAYGSVEVRPIWEMGG